MRIRIPTLIATAAALSALVLVGGSAPAQTKPGAKPGTKPAMTGTQTGSAMSHAGEIVGNKSTKVYHLPGSKGNMPSEKNRVYFKTEVEARAAGYHPAGAKTTMKKGPARDAKTGRFVKKH